MYDEVLVINPVGEILTEYVIHTVDGTRQLYLCGSAYKESHFSIFRLQKQDSLLAEMCLMMSCSGSIKTQMLFSCACRIRKRDGIVQRLLPKDLERP